MKKLVHDQRGLAHLMIIVLAVVVLAGIGGVGYYVVNSQKKTKNKSADSTASTTASVVADKVVNDECNQVLKDKDFCKFAGNWSGVKNYKAEFTATTDEGTTVMTIEMENDNRSSVVATSGGKVIMAFVTIDNVSYIKSLVDGTWTKYTSNAKKENIKEEVSFDFKDNPATPDVKEDQTQYKKAGKESCGSLNCFKYQVVDPASPNDQQFVWFDDDDYMLRRWTIDNAEGKSSIEISYGNVKVTAPSPVKDAPTYSTPE